MSESKGSTLKDLMKQNIFMILVSIAVIWITFYFLTDGKFLTARNISNLFRQMSITGMISIGMIFVIISNEIDLSAGSAMALLGGIAAILNVKLGFGVFSVIVITLLLGMLIGLWNGFWVSLKIPSFIVTLAGMLAFRGILVGITGGRTIAPVTPTFKIIGQSYLPNYLSYLIVGVLIFAMFFTSILDRKNKIENGIKVGNESENYLKLGLKSCSLLVGVFLLNQYYGVPTPVMILAIFIAIFSFVSKKTVFGRLMYAIGGNKEAVRLSGINVDKIKISIYVVHGMLVAIAGLILTSRLAAASVSAGTNAELDAIAACYIGGASTSGGVGTVFGAILGALVMASLDNGMSMMNVEPSWQYVVKGMILLLAVLFDIMSKNKK
ncbi:sugar ABC transporter permease [Cetobacterium sp. 8H]|uniref:sugar ABC transporter permease n=1 Tax=Cetobacterium sp. 8H TaxID=2759681 RepID=UPI00163CEFF0|nr:sugar ABC transporter permease [Cetobacterium sp. 8H]MBC2850922.1 sugar ABC transporter permease [Cetobacterium sp. 8H]